MFVPNCPYCKNALQFEMHPASFSQNHNYQWVCCGQCKSILALIPGVYAPVLIGKLERKVDQLTAEVSTVSRKLANLEQSIEALKRKI